MELSFEEEGCLRVNKINYPGSYFRVPVRLVDELMAAIIMKEVFTSYGCLTSAQLGLVSRKWRTALSKFPLVHPSMVEFGLINDYILIGYFCYYNLINQQEEWNSF